MLQKIRDNSSGPLAYAVVAVIVVVFGVWGIGSYLTPSATTSVAEVNGASIAETTLRRAFNQNAERAGSRRAVLENLIRQRLLTQYARSAGYRVTDDDVLAALRTQPAFKKNGRFSKQRYRQALARAGLEPAQYEAGLRQRLLSQAVGAQIVGHALALPSAVDAIYRRLHQQRRVAYLTFSASAFRDSIDVSRNDVRAFYQKHSDRYQRPRRVKLAYVMLDANALPAGKAPSQDKLKALYRQNKSSLGQPEKRAARVVRVPITKGDAAGARQAIQDVAQKIDAGTDLAAAADAVPAAALETVAATSRAKAGAAVAEPLFSLAVNKVSNPVQASNAWLIVQPTRIEPAQRPAFSDPAVQKKLRRMAERRSQRARFQAKRKQMADLAVQAPNGLETLSNQLGLSVHKTGWVTRKDGENIAAKAKVRKAAFSNAVLGQRLNSDVIGLGDGRAVVLRVANKQPAAQRPLKTVRAKVRRQLIQTKALAAARAAAENARARLQHSDATLKTVADGRAGVKLHPAAWLSRQSQPPSAALRQSIFAMAPPGAGESTRFAVTTTNGQVALLALFGLRDNAAHNKRAQKQRQALASRESRYMGALEYAAFSSYLRATGDVAINEQALAGG